MKKIMKKYIIISVIIGLVAAAGSMIAVGQLAPKMIKDHAAHMTKQVELAREEGVISSEEAEYYKKLIELEIQYYLEQGFNGFGFGRKEHHHGRLGYMSRDNITCRGMMPINR